MRGNSRRSRAEAVRIGHITQPDANLFLELGFPPAEAERLQADSRRQIDAVLRLKQQLVDELSRWIEERHLKQAEAAAILGVTRPCVSDVVHGKTARFSIDALVDMLGRAGKPVRLAVD